MVEKWTKIKESYTTYFWILRAGNGVPLLNTNNMLYYEQEMNKIRTYLIQLLDNMLHYGLAMDK